jgi:NhaA family Na+:H+ antiporter
MLERSLDIEAIARIAGLVGAPFEAGFDGESSLRPGRGQDRVATTIPARTRRMTTAQPRAISALRAFLKSESAGGLLLMGSAALALVVANSPLADGYFHALHVYVGGLSVAHWVNDGLMAVFFLLVGLEIKRETVDGELSSWSRRVLPGVAALGGMIVPALIYVAVNLRPRPTCAAGPFRPPPTSPSPWGCCRCWARACRLAEDLPGRPGDHRRPGRDPDHRDLLHRPPDPLGPGRRGRDPGGPGGDEPLKVMKLWPYLLVGAGLWFFFLKSGVHATLAGVILAMTIPITKSPARPDDEHSPLHRLEHGLNPWVGYLVVPVFGFANAGVALGQVGLAELTAPATLGASLGLFLGKPIGVGLFCLAAIKLGWAQRPSGASWTQLFGVSALCGIGFTMSLFINNLAFDADPAGRDQDRRAGRLAAVGPAGLAGFSLAPRPRDPHISSQA